MPRHDRLLLILLIAALGLSACGGSLKKLDRQRNAYAVDLAKRQLWQEAGYHWELLLEKHPENVTILNNRAVAALKEGRFEEAKAMFEAALDRDPDNKSIKKNIEMVNRFLRLREERLEEIDSGVPLEEEIDLADEEREDTSIEGEQE